MLSRVLTQLEMPMDPTPKPAMKTQVVNDLIAVCVAHGLTDVATGEIVGVQVVAVPDARQRVVLLLGDPHLLEGAQGGQDGAAYPHRVAPLHAVGGADDLRPGRQAGGQVGWAPGRAGRGRAVRTAFARAARHRVRKGCDPRARKDAPHSSPRGKEGWLGHVVRRSRAHCPPGARRS